MNEVTGFSILFASVGLLFIGLSVPLILRRIPPNRLYGCRTTRSLSDPKAWHDANHAAGKNFLISRALVFAVSLTVL